MSAPKPEPRRVTRAELLARRAEALQQNARPITDEQTKLLDLVTEMAREMYRMAYALDGVV